MSPSWEVIEGEALAVLRGLPAASAQACITSPPYWRQRDYGVPGQLGLEPTPEAYIAGLVAVFREVRRVLRPDGALWLNLGDSYNAQRGKQNLDRLGAAFSGGGHKASRERFNLVSPRPAGFKPKDLYGMPWRLALALQADGWYLRADVIWEKPNGKPENVQDRPTRTHEYLFLLAAGRRYYYDAAAIAEPQSTNERRRRLREHGAGHRRRYRAALRGTRNRRSVWRVATVPAKHAHLAAFPPKLARLCVLSAAAAGAVILDPFCGSGTTGLVALAEGRRFVGIELNPEYAALARERIQAAAGAAAWGALERRNQERAPRPALEQPAEMRAESARG